MNVCLFALERFLNGKSRLGSEGDKVFLDCSPKRLLTQIFKGIVSFNGERIKLSSLRFNPSGRVVGLLHGATSVPNLAR